MAKAQYETFGQVKTTPIYHELVAYADQYDELSAWHMFTDKMLQKAIQLEQEVAIKPLDMQQALIQFKHRLDRSPYDLALLSYVTLQHVDMFLLKLLPKTHPWHLTPDSQSRCDGIIDYVFKVTRLNGSSVLTQREFNDEINNFAFQNLTYAEIKKYRRAIVTNIRESKHYRKTSYQASTQFDDQYLTGYISTRYQRGVATGVSELLGRCGDAKLKSVVDTDALLDVFDELANEDGFTLSSQQQQIVQAILTNPVSIVLGSAGTGKSTLLKATCRYLAQQGIVPVLTAYSGKAAFNLQAMTDLPAKTMLSMLYKKPQQLGQARYVIIDEISMVPELLMGRFLNHCADNAHIILVGDHAQFPAVQDVGFMTTLLQYLTGPYNRIPYYQLTHVFRQANGSNLLDAVTTIRKGRPARLQLHVNDIDDTLSYQHVTDIKQVEDYYLHLLKTFPNENVVLLTPYRKGEYGTIKLNQHLQSVYADALGKTPLVIPKRYGPAQVFYARDRVLVTKNMYDVQVCDEYGNALSEPTDVLNGFVGEIISYQSSPQVEVFVRLLHCGPHGDDLYVKFYPEKKTRNTKVNLASLDNLDLGYALTAHKSQGSTIDHVIYYLPRASCFYLTRQSLYTAYTRAKHLTVMSDMDLTDHFLDLYVQRDAYLNLKSNLSYLMNVYTAKYLMGIPAIEHANQFQVTI